MERRATRLLAVAFLPTVLAGCTEAVMKRLVTPETDRFARDYIEAVHHGSDSVVLKALTPQALSQPGLIDSIHSVRAQFAPGAIRRIELADASVDMRRHVTTRRILYQVETDSGFTMVDMQVAEELGLRFVHGLHVERIPRSVQETNALTLRGKGPAHYLMTAVGLAALAYALWAALTIARTPMPRRWWWVLTSLLGACKILFDWNTGQVFLQPISVSLLPIGIVRSGLLGPWRLAISLPIGAAIALSRRRKWIRERSSAAPAEAVGEPSAS